MKLCNELYLHQVTLGRHFHLEQPQGLEALTQKELNDVAIGTLRIVFDMCEVGGLKIVRGNAFLRKRTVVYTTSGKLHLDLEARYCRGNYMHELIRG